MPSIYGNSLNSDRRLFRQEIRAAIAHSNALFRAGALTRIEAERLKNGLWTILKRADFDQHFFDAAPSEDVFTFIENRLFTLVNTAAAALKIGRSRPVQLAVALRLWLRDELEVHQEALDDLLETIATPSADDFSIAFANQLARDQTKLREIRARVNRMPVTDLRAADETIAELDHDGAARELGFDAIIENSHEGAIDRDFCAEFVGAATLTMIHLASFAEDKLRRNDSAIAAPNSFAAIRARCAQMLGHQTALFAILQSFPNAADVHEFDAINQLMFAAADALRTTLTELKTDLSSTK